MKYLLWDWNGTLLDDTEAALATLNQMIAERGAAPMSMEFYRDHFRFPVRPFYDSIGIVAKDEAEWNYIAREYHEVYARQPKRLNRETVTVLEAVRRAGVHQSIISALRQDLLEGDLATYGVREYFDEVYGTDNLNGTSKLDRAHELIATLAARDSEPATLCSRITLIGDALHDREVAAALGVRCVLCAQGSHAAHRLRAVAPTGDTLGEAVRLALS